MLLQKGIDRDKKWCHEAQDLGFLFNSKPHMFSFLNCAAAEKLLTILCIFQMWSRLPDINYCQAILFPMSIRTISYNKQRFCHTSRAESRNLMKDKYIGLISLFFLNLNLPENIFSCGGKLLWSWPDPQCSSRTWSREGFSEAGEHQGSSDTRSPTALVGVAEEALVLLWQWRPGP